jgi:hypothetical protein
MHPHEATKPSEKPWLTVQIHDVPRPADSEAILASLAWFIQSSLFYGVVKIDVIDDELIVTGGDFI